MARLRREAPAKRATSIRRVQGGLQRRVLVTGVVSGIAILTLSLGIARTPSALALPAAPAPNQLEFTRQPSGVTEDVLFSTKVTVEDAFFTPIENATGPVTLTLAPPVTVEGTPPAMPGIATPGLFCYDANAYSNPPPAGSGAYNNRATPVNGVASFGCTINAAGSAFTLVASDIGDTPPPAPTTSLPFSVGTATRQLAFETEPKAGIAQQPFVPQPVVAVEDTSGDVDTTAKGPIAISLTPGTSATLTCSVNDVYPVAGVATFAGCSINQAGGPYTLTATDSGPDGASSAMSDQFQVSGQSTLAFTTQPGSGEPGKPLSTQPVVQVRDAFGQVMTDAVGPVVLAVTANTGPGSLSCANGEAAYSSSNAPQGVTPTLVDGVARFSGCTVETGSGGTTYTLSATDAGDGVAVQALSSPFSVEEFLLNFTTEPSGGVGNQPWPVQPVVSVQDAYGMTINDVSGSVKIRVTSGSSPVLRCTGNANNPDGSVTATLSGGVATFSGCNVDTAGVGYTLTATGSGEDAVNNPLTFVSGTLDPSTPFAVVDATELVDIQDPQYATAGMPFAVEPSVALEVYQSPGSQVPPPPTGAPATLSVFSGPDGGALGGCKSSFASGVTQWSACSLGKAGTYVLEATDTADDAQPAYFRQLVP